MQHDCFRLKLIGTFNNMPLPRWILGTSPACRTIISFAGHLQAPLGPIRGPAANTSAEQFSGNWRVLRSCKEPTMRVRCATTRSLMLLRNTTWKAGIAQMFLLFLLVCHVGYTVPCIETS